MRFFLDTSSLLKLYYKEPDSLLLRAQVPLDNELVVAELAWVEVHSAFQTKVCTSTLSQTWATRKLKLFALDWPNFTRIALTTDVLSQAATLIAIHKRLALRSLDAIQLAAALAAGPLDAFFTHDERLRQAALAEDLPVR